MFVYLYRFGNLNRIHVSKRMNKPYIEGTPMKSIPLWLFAPVFFFFSCNRKAQDPLPSWNETPVRQSILKFISEDAKSIPVEDRIAVFDMDGTIACEMPLWYEMYAAVYGLNLQSAKDPGLLGLPEYQYAGKLAKNPADTSVSNHFDAYMDSMVWKAYAGIDHEVYVDSTRSYLSRTKDPKYGLFLADMFYQPMLELISYLKENGFTIYIVSGSMQGCVWSVCPQVLGIDRAHLLGTRQMMVPVYDAKNHRTQFVIGKGVFSPTNDGNGKSLNLYSRIGKVPVFAFGNTMGDFGMFHLTSTSKYPHAVYMLNHNDSIREYAYPPYYGTAVPHWKDSLEVNHWNQVNMAREFKTVWMNK